MAEVKRGVTEPGWELTGGREFGLAAYRPLPDRLRQILDEGRGAGVCVTAFAPDGAHLEPAPRHESMARDRASRIRAGG